MSWQDDPVVEDWQNDPVTQQHGGVGVPELPTQVVTPSEGGGLDLQRMKAGLPPGREFPEAPASGMAPYIVGATEAVVPQSLSDLVHMAILPRAEPIDVERENQLGAEWRGEYGPEAQARSITGTAMAGLPLLHLPFSESPLRPTPADISLVDQINLAQAQAAQPPPIPPEYAERRFTMQDTPPEQPPQLAPAPPIEQTLSNIGQPLPFNPELGPQPQPPDFQMPLRTDMAQSPNAQPLFPTPPPGTPLKGTPLVGPNGSTPAADAAQTQPQPQLPAIPAGDERYAGVTPQTTTPATEGVGGNVKGFEQVYGAGEVPAGPTLTPEDAWDSAKLRAQLGQSNPYGIVSRAKTGAITPAEMGDLIYEHHRLVERAAGLEGTPDYEGAYQAASTFANNVLKPAENAWHQKGMTMQIARPIDFSTETGMRNAMDRMNVELKANQASEANRIVRENAKAKADVNGAEDKLMKAMDKEYSKGEKRAPKTAEQLRAQLAETEPCAL